MKQPMKLKLAAAHQSCQEKKATAEFMLQFMQWSCNVDLATCIEYFSLGKGVHKKLFREVDGIKQAMEIVQGDLGRNKSKT